MRAVEQQQVVFPKNAAKEEVLLSELALGPHQRFQRRKDRDARALKLVEAVPELQQLQFSVLQAATVAGVLYDPDGNIKHEPTKVQLQTTAAIPYYKRAGSYAKGVKLHTVLERKLIEERNPRRQRQRCCFIAVKPQKPAPVEDGDAAGSVDLVPMENNGAGTVEAVRPETEEPAGEWIAELIAWVSYDLPGGKWSEPEAYVRWFQEDPDGKEESELLEMTRLRVEKDERVNQGGAKVPVDFTDLVKPSRIMRPVYVLQHPIDKNLRYYNPYAR